jgi:hypothetical protein
MEKFERLDPGDEERDEDEEEEEEEEEDGDPRDARSQGVGAIPAVSAPAVVQATASRKKGTGSSHRGQEIRKRGRVPNNATTPTQADLLWLDVLQRKEIVSNGIEAEHFSIKVYRLDGSQAIYLTAIDGMRCAGDGRDGSAGDALLRILTDEIHWHSSKGLAATYQLEFSFKRGGTIYDKGKIRLPSTQEIGQMRAAEMGLGKPPNQYPQQQGYPQQPPPYGPQGYAPQGFGAPPPQYGPGMGNGYPPPYGYPPYGYPPPPHPGYPGLGAPPAPSTGDEVTDLKEQVRSLSEMVRDMWRFGPGGMPQGMGGFPPGYGQPPPPQGLPMSALSEMQRHLAGFGLTIAPAHQPGTAMVPAASGFQTGLGQLKELAVGVSALKEVADALNGVFNMNAQQVVEEPKPEPDFEMVEVPGSKWPNGEPIRYARDDKGINWFGTAMGNGYAMDRFGTTMAGLGRRIVSQINKEQGVGALADEEEEEEEEEEQPQQQQQPQQSVVTPPPQNPPPPRMNGAQNYPPRDDGFSL